MVAYFRKQRKTIIVAIVIIVLILFSGNKGYGLYKNLIRQNLSKMDSLTELSQHKQDSLNTIIINGIATSQLLSKKINELSKNNKYLYRKLKNREKDLLLIDTSFISNSKYIAERENRQSKKDSTIK